MENIPCKLCGNETPFKGTKLCNSCWELNRRIEADPKVARTILWRVEPKDPDELSGAEKFLREFARHRLYEIRANGVLAYKVQKFKQTGLDADILDEAIFNNFLGMKVQEIYFSMTGKKTELTRGNDVYHQDDVFRKVIESLIAEEAYNFEDFFGEINS